MSNKFVFIEPLDFLILDKLEDEGTMFAGLYQLGTQVSSLRKTKPFDKLTADQISSRLRLMKSAGYTRQVKIVGGDGKGAWQRTKAGAEELTKWKDANGHGD